MILASIWAFIGIGMAILVVQTMVERYPNKYHYSTHAVGALLVLLFWPILIVVLLSGSVWRLLIRTTRQ